MEDRLDVSLNGKLSKILIIRENQNLRKWREKKKKKKKILNASVDKSQQKTNINNNPK